MSEVLQFGEYPAETTFQAQDLYCIDRLTYEQVAAQTGVSVRTLKRWGQQYDWRAKREKLAQNESEIRLGTYEARARMIKKVVEDGNALDAFAVAKLETMVIEQARFKAEQKEAAAPSPVEFKTPAEAAALLEKALSHKLGALLAAPSELNLKTLKDLREALTLLSEMRGQPAEEDTKEVGLSREAEAKIKEILTGPFHD